MLDTGAVMVAEEASAEGLGAKSLTLATSLIQLLSALGSIFFILTEVFLNATSNLAFKK